MNILIVGASRANYRTTELAKLLIERAWYPGYRILLDDRPGVSAVCAWFAEHIRADYCAYGIGERAISRAVCYTRLEGTAIQRDNWLIERADVVVSVGATAMYYRALRAGKKTVLRQVEGARR